MATPKKQSIFAQRMQNLKEAKKKKAEHMSISGQHRGLHSSVEVFANAPAASNIIQGVDAEAIHQENLQKLSQMTASEIEEEQQRLISKLDPNIVAFLRSKRSVNPSKTTDHAAQSSKDVNSGSSQIKHSAKAVGAPTPVAELVNKFPHMDVVEPEKMQWMQDPPPPPLPAKGVPYNARFNFNGELLPYADDEGLTPGLHHHGEEPQRPGYTLSELMQLSRSSMLQQRVTAISTLANIFHKASDYDYCLEKPLLPQLLDSELYLLLRFTLDDPVRSVVSAAVAAISSLLTNAKDEGCLDRLLGLSTGLRQPSFYVHLDLKPNELAELKDTELLKVDVIRGALRTHLLPRFRYILDKLECDAAEISHVMRCLIRIARHSYEAALAISNTPGLLTVVRRLMDERPPRACSDVVKLFRVMACQSQSLAAHLVDTYCLLQPLQRFIAGDREETNMSLSLESLYTWQTLLTYNLTTEHISAFTPVVQRLLVTYADAVSLAGGGGDLEHAAALLSWLTAAARVCPEHCPLPPLQLCALKWLSQACQLPSLKWGACKLLEALLRNLAALADLKDFKSKDIENKVDTFLKSDNFSHLSQKLRKCSWLLHGETNPSVVESLPCLGSIPPTIYDDSPLPLMMGLAVYVCTTQSPQLAEKFACSEGIQRYVEQVMEGGVKVTISHWFARQEILFIYTLLQIHLNMQSPVESSLLHRAAMFLSVSIHADDRHMLTDLFDRIIFNQHFFRPEISDIVAEVQRLQISSDSDVSTGRSRLLNEALDSLDTIRSCYQRELGLVGLTAGFPPPTLTASYQGTDPALPADWHFLPIVHLNNIDGKREDAANVAVCCLQWSLILECLRPQFSSKISLASRYCRLACVLLAGNDLFRDARDWLREVLLALLVHDKDMDFDQDIPGLKSFYDFYRQVVEQFVGVSYGDPVFGQFVLIPLQQRHSARLRKLIWCEMGAALRFLSTPIDEVGVPVSNFLEPCETDLDLLLIYLTALAQGRVRETFCPMLFRVAVHHVATFTFQHAHQPAAKRLSQMIDALGNQNLKNLLKNYCTTR